MENQTVKNVQDKILYVMKFIDKLCRENDITYYLMGGTALGAVRHGGFIPWDDDLDIFMTPENYKKFAGVFNSLNSNEFVLQEWKTTNDYLEYAKVRLNGTTFIEDCFKDRKDMHHGIYVDIMILHKCPDNKCVQKSLYFKCKYVTLYALSQRNWKPKTKFQKFALWLIKLLPNKWLVKSFYKHIYKYDDKPMDDYKWFYWITPAKFRAGLFDKEFFDNHGEIQFEDSTFMCPDKIHEYLAYRYGDYMKLPPVEQQQAAVHAMYYDTEKDYTEYFKEQE